MLTPVELEKKTFKSGFGYNKREVDNFKRNVLNNYEKIYKENIELKDKLTILNEGISYYKTMEESMQKALVLAEKTAEETKLTAHANAANIEKEAELRAQAIIQDSKDELTTIQNNIRSLIQQYESYKIQIKQFLKTQQELIDNKAYKLDFNITNELIASTDELPSSTNEHENNSKINSINDSINENDEDYKMLRTLL